jgi:hypothetical protein
MYFSRNDLCGDDLSTKEGYEPCINCELENLPAHRTVSLLYRTIPEKISKEIPMRLEFGLPQIGSNAEAEAVNKVARRRLSPMRSWIQPSLRDEVRSLGLVAGFEKPA